ncbi:MAG: nucleotide-binding protein [Candidatus Altiarchaeota archaeon]|nr:nucleotide-binding protein [Candidatus Altiarchaeota archaeon]
MALLVLVDTNFLFLPCSNKVDFFSEMPSVIPEVHEIVTLSTVVSELEKLSSGRGDDATAARIGIELLRRNGIRVIPASGRADDSIVEYALENKGNVIVCTNDLLLKRRLRENGIPLVVLRSKNHLMRL